MLLVLQTVYRWQHFIDIFHASKHVYEKKNLFMIQRMYLAVAQSYHQLTPRLSALNPDCTDY